MRLCAIGDSFVNGTGDAEALGWIGRLVRDRKATNPELTLYNLGIRRDTSADVHRRWRAEATARRVAGVDFGLVFSFGVNDCVIDPETGRERIDPLACRDHAAAILADAPTLGRVLMVGPVPIADDGVNDRVEALDSLLKTCAAVAGVPYLPVFADLKASKTWMTAVTAWDGAHPGAEGYAELARLVGAWDAWQAWFA